MFVVESLVIRKSFNPSALTKAFVKVLIPIGIFCLFFFPFYLGWDSERALNDQTQKQLLSLCLTALLN